VVAVAATACGGGSSAGPSASKSTPGSGGKTIKVGLLTDITGLASSGNKSSVDGLKAGVVAAARDGYTIKYVVADTQSNPASVQTAAQKLVQQDGAKVVIAHSSLAFAAAPFLTKQNVPVVGVAEDGPEWVTAPNMFSVYGPIHTEKVATTFAKFFKLVGATNLGALGYSIAPQSANAAKAIGVAAPAVGLKAGYINAKFPFGSTDVGPEVLAMKSAGVDGFVAEVDPNTSFAMITGLRDQGVDLKVALLPTGYGGDLTQAGQGALKAAQNVYFAVQYEPVEMQTAATKQFSADLRSAGVAGAPTYAEYNAYAAVTLLVEALKAAGSSPTRTSLLQALAGIHDFDAAGLYGSHKIDINDRKNVVAGTGCMWVTKLEGTAFKLVSGAEPICGDVIPGVTVSS
jgi:ABC-type branched-subunit amino acid transport system substrate-binding protein